MHVLLGKKQIVLAALVVALGLAVFVNWYYTSDNTRLYPEGAASADGDTIEVADGQAQLVGTQEDSVSFSEIRLSRDTAHAEAMDELQSVMASATESEASVSTAKAIEELSGIIRMESDIESLVTGKTGSDCVAVISSNTVEVVVPSAALTDMNVLTISDVVNEVCTGKYENIKISGAAGSRQ